ncbi:MAG: adenylate/guanylate cyclase domain-containing protein [Gammaproteobacteria bacterium]|nr:adenylate/guanylate cyclase domain-containing protein [Gammaproteobacteria bacterium]
MWPALSDTARFNEAATLPKHEIEELPQPDGSVRYLARARIGPLTLAWEEQPVNWVHEQWFEHCRRFLNGPLEFLCATARMFPEPDGCRCEYTVRVAARSLLGEVMLRSGFFARIDKTFSPLAQSARDFAAGRRATPFDCKRPALAAGGAQRAAEAARRIDATPHGHGVAEKLADLVLQSQEVDVWSIRPLALARQWGISERQAVELCLEAAKQGLLRMRWDLLCPRCQVGKGSVFALDELPRGAHCATCNIDYDQDFSNNVELVFQPASSVRPMESGEYCLFGPMSTPHIKVQLTLEPGEVRDVPVVLPFGHYRVRTLEPGGEQSFEWREGGFPQVTTDGDVVRAGAPAQPDLLRLRNVAERRLTLIVEEHAWKRDVLTAKRATTYQTFRDLFTDQVLRPGDDVSIDHVTIMFTDLKGSTALYERIGDPIAYALVREHFAILGRAVRESDGAIVKTIGDAIMAVFVNPADALRCAVRIHADFASYNETSSGEPLIIKLGLHIGRCISVTLNDRLDYYGTSANKAARLQGQSIGGDIVLSPEFAADPMVAPLLERFTVREERAELKGFDEPIRFYRIPAESLAPCPI